MDYKNPKLVVESAKLTPGSVSWRSPSNLAIIKYWGKYGDQLPRNPSISITLDKAYTETTLEYRAKVGNLPSIQLQLYYNGQIQEQFQAKTQQFFERLTDVFPFLRQLDLTIRTTNSFPHSTGIASSASAMSALALCLCDLERQLFGTLREKEIFFQKASFIARLGSGSACRSIYPVMALWGETRAIPEASNLFAIPYAEQVHAIYHSLHDDILIISKTEKEVSSRAGHGLMEGNIFAENRYQQARQRLTKLIEVLKNGDIDTFGSIAEREALSLHALMMTSEPPYILLKPNTLAAIERVREFRSSTKIPLYFSLDAGPNLHLLYPDSEKKTVQQFIRGELTGFCEQHLWIEDRAGHGPEKID